MRVTAQAPHDFSGVLEALTDHTRRYERPSVSVSGWEVEDAAMRPPAPLLHALAGLPARPLGYASPRTFARAKEHAAAILGARLRFGGVPVQPEQVTFTANSTQALLLVFAALTRQGISRLAVAAPAYFAAVESARHLGLEVVVIPSADFLTGALDLERLASCADGHTAFLVTNPAYSIGVAHRPGDLRELSVALGERTPVVLDEARLGLPWSGGPPWYTADYPPNVVVIRSPSKIFFADGVKLGIVVGSAALMGEIERCGDALVGSLAGNAEAAAMAYLDALHSWDAECMGVMMGPFRSWRAGVVARMRATLGKVEQVLADGEYQHSDIDSGPYVLAARPHHMGPRVESMTVAREHGVLLMDSRYFLHESPRFHGFRINLAADPQTMPEALARALTAQRDTARRCVLVGDDENSIREVLGE